MNSEFIQWLGGMPWFGWIAIVAIVSGCITGALQARYKHIERIEMIRQGMNPDAGKPAGVDDCS